jgi:hypothetical protein
VVSSLSALNGFGTSVLGKPKIVQGDMVVELWGKAAALWPKTPPQRAQTERFPLMLVVARAQARAAEGNNAWLRQRYLIVPRGLWRGAF